MIVAVTGGTGFIGRAVVRRHLLRGDRVRVLSRRATPASDAATAEVFHGDLLREDVKLDRFLDGADVLYHCAGELRDERRMAGLHVGGTARLVAAARGRIGRWVQLSSVGVYGRRRDGVIDETTPPAPATVYEQTKTRSDEVVMAAAAGGAFESAVLRPAIVFGPDMPNRSLFGLIRAVTRGMFFFVGPPGASANYVHVENVAEALLLCGTAAEARERVYNLCDGRTIEEFVTAIAVAAGTATPRRRVPEALARRVARWVGQIPGFPLTESRVDALCTRAVYPSNRIEQELTYRHLVPIEEGLKEIVERCRDDRRGHR